MHLRKQSLILACALAAFFAVGVRCNLNPAHDRAPCNVYLTWQGETSTSITVNFHTLTSGGGQPIVYYDTMPHALNLDAYAFSQTGTVIQMPAGTDERFVHSVELTDLTPGEEYYFVATLDDLLDEDLDTYSTGQRAFRTISSDTESLRFITGGDMDTHLATWDLLRRARDTNPMFGVIGGDIAYANGDLGRFSKWDRWLSMWEEIMIDDEGRLIPLVLAIGNHEVDGGYDGEPEDAPFFLNYFPQDVEKKTYFARSFGANLVLYILDTDHIVPHGGAQADWLRGAMNDHSAFMHQFAVYHVPLYPSHRTFLNPRSIAGRLAWQPIFDEFGLDTAFENHDHTLKRTVRLRDGAPDSKGTLYLGDGAFGQFTRDINDLNRSYLAFAESTRHFWVVEIDGDTVTYRAIDRNGAVVDEVSTGGTRSSASGTTAIATP